MGRAAVDRPQFNFGAGLVTEATGLTYPENSAKELLNVDLALDGSVRRRFGLDFEANGGGIPGTPPSEHLVDVRRQAYSAHIWTNPAGIQGLNLLVLQLGRWIHIRDLDAPVIADPSYSAPRVGANTSQFLATNIYGWDGATSTELEQSVLSSTNGDGKLFMTGAHWLPFYLSYDAATPRVNFARFGGGIPPTSGIIIRDLTGINDGTAVSNTPSAPITEEHYYNLINIGWTDARIFDYQADATVLNDEYLYPANTYPSRAMTAYAAKTSAGAFDPPTLKRIDFGNSPAGRGRLFLDALVGDRDGNVPAPSAAMQGAPHLLPADIDFDSAYDERALHGGSFTAIAFFAGRLWLSGDRNAVRGPTIYFSQVIEDITNAPKMYSENDATSEYFSDPLDTDGGTIRINDSGYISSLVPFNEGILALAANGVWWIRGGDAGFSATAYSADKISPARSIAPQAVVVTDDVVFFWSEEGIYAISFQNGTPTVQNITDAKIRQLFKSIPSSSKASARSVYNTGAKRVEWFYNADLVDAGQNTTNRMLLLDMRLGAFHEYSVPRLLFFSDGQPFRSVFIATGWSRRSTDGGAQEQLVYVGDDVVVDGTTPITAGEAAQAVGGFNSTTKYLFIDGFARNGVVVNTLYWSAMQFNSTLFMDFDAVTAAFYTANTGVYDYTSLVTTGDIHLGDLQRVKMTPWVHSFFLRTEYFWQNNISDVVVLANQSGATAQMAWDWHSTDQGERWSDKQTVYRFRVPLPTAPAHDDLLNIGASINYTKVKVRGKGRALSLHYESVSGKDFRLLGYSLPVTANEQ